MPKMKLNSSAKKRFKLTAKNKIIRNHAYKNHILTKKSSKRKRFLGHVALVASSDVRRVKRMLCSS